MDLKFPQTVKLRRALSGTIDTVSVLFSARVPRPVKRICQLVCAAGVLAVSNAGLSETFSAGAWRGYEQSCSAHRAYQNPESDVSLGVFADADHSTHVSIVRKSWSSYRPAVSVRIDAHPVAQKSSEGITPDTLLIDLGPEASIRSFLEQAAALSIDTGAEVLRYNLSDMPLLLAKLDECVNDLRALPEVEAPPPGSVALGVNVPKSRTQTLAQRCERYTNFVIYHGSWDHEPTAKERTELRKYTQDVAPCVSLWKERCKPIDLFPTGSTYAFCEIQIDAALAHLANRRTLERREESHRQYNNRGEEIDRIFKQATDGLIASAQKPIDNYKEARRQEEESRDRQATALREEELIAVLRQLANQQAAPPAPGRPVTTDCVGSETGNSVQCTTY